MSVSVPLRRKQATVQNFTVVFYDLDTQTRIEMDRKEFELSLFNEDNFFGHGMRSEEILNVWVYKTPLYDWQWTDLIMNHQFMILETVHCYWSVEKAGEGIVIQKSRDIDVVFGCYGVDDTCVARLTPITKIKENDCRGKEYYMMHFAHFLLENANMLQGYNLLSNNCKHFVAKLFDEISTSMWLRNYFSSVYHRFR